MAFRKQDTSSEFVKKEDLKDGFKLVLSLVGYIALGYIILILFAGIGTILRPPNKSFSNLKPRLLFSDVEISVYNPKASQTDSTPLITFCGDTISLKDSTLQNWVAISPDLFKSLNLSCRDSVVIICGQCPYDGIKMRVSDTTHTKIKGRIDVLEHGNVSTGLYEGYIIHECK